MYATVDRSSPPDGRSSVAGYLVVGLGYLVYGAVVATGYVLFAAGWLIWHTARISYRVLDWTVDKCAPPIAARWHRWRDSRAVPEPVTAEIDLP